MKKWWLMALLLASGMANAAIELGKDYVLLPQPQAVANPKKVEVIEFFSYHCIHCYELEPALTAWEKKRPADVNFRKEQIVWQKPMEGFARLFATMNATGTLTKLNRPAFEAVVKNRINLADASVLTGWIRKQPGIDAAKFMQAYSSFSVNAQVARAVKITRDYNIEGTPTFVVNGKYAIQPAAPERLLQVLNELIAKARAEKK